MAFRSFRCVGLVLCVSACTGDDEPMMMMPPVVTECMGASVVPLAGDHTVVISDLEIGTEMDGFDLDGDMMPDNKLALVNQLAGPAIRDALDNFELMLPIEFFDFASVGADDCVKFGIYLGHYRQDLDGDGNDTANDRGDCNDLPGAGVAIFRGAAESCDVPEGPGCGDRVDNDCDGKAEEVVLSTTNDAGVTMTMETASSDTGDIDLDGVSVAAGDCDDHDPMIKPGLLEVCRDGLDNDCDGHADFGMDQAGMPACTPYDDTPDEIDLDPLSFLEGQARISFKNGKAVAVGSNVNLEAGPSVFGVNVPIADGINLDLRISNTMIVSQVAMDGDGVRLSEGRLGGVLDAYTLDQVRGLEIMQINLRPEDSMLDAMFANVLGLLLSLEKNEMDCLMPDIDIDKDGLEAFCDTNPDDMIDIIDLCIDGDGTMIADGEMGTVQCTEAMKDGKRRFVDGVSIEMNFAAVPVILPAELP